MKLIIEQAIKPRKDIATEDGGQYKGFWMMEDESAEDGMYIKVCSWDTTRKHIDFKKFIGKKVRLTLEVIE